MITPTELIEMLYPKEKSYQWFFNEILNTKSSNTKRLKLLAEAQELIPEKMERLEKMILNSERPAQ